MGIFSRLLLRHTSSSHQCSNGCTRTWHPGGRSVRNWSQDLGGGLRKSHTLPSPRGLQTRSFARVPSSSRRIPAMTPVSSCSTSKLFRPARLPAAERAAGGKVGCISSTGGHVPTVSLRFYSSLLRSQKSYISGSFFSSQQHHDCKIPAQRPPYRKSVDAAKRFAQHMDGVLKGLRAVSWYALIF